MGVSVIICCYNSKDRIYPTLKHLSEQQVPASIPWEIILVNNNSTDDTVEAANRYWVDLKSDFQFSIVNERQPGLSNARRRGLECSRYPYLIFCDDDNWLFPQYVAMANDAMEKLPQAGVIGGYGKPFCEETPPDWFAKYSSNYATGLQSEKYSEGGIVDITMEKSYVYGAAAVFRKSALIQLYKSNFKNILTDRTGESLLSGGDNELCYSLKLRGYRIYFHLLLEFQHFVPANRLTEEYLLKLNEGFGYSYMMLLPYQYKMTGRKMHGIKVSSWWLLACSIFLHIVNDLPQMIFKNLSGDINFRVHLAGRKGAIIAFWRNRKDINSNFKYVDAFFGSYKIEN